ncbi:hypothetical protein SAMN04244579_02710 [Azotobacter beijerinckii]|uniref:Bacteriophage protein n=1 Tax=Azotobacter beijerinckii TaxID=170623 RepID=A0A1H6VES0_9GAMM|nr:hypothetical protein [Azotobacter beijerinckii]SEI98782.1 hypothetical protein SAMN04244579_02710 [Azotobacter beijerinckii]
MSNAFLYRMPAGIPGDVTRASQSTIEPVVLDPNTPFTAFGVFGKIVSNKFVPFGAGDADGGQYGLYVRPYPITGGSGSDPLGTATPPTKGIADCLRRGYMTVKVNAGTASKDSQVYVRVAAAAAGKPIGGIEAVADSTNTIAITGATFMGAADASGNVEIAYNI